MGLEPPGWYAVKDQGSTGVSVVEAAKLDALGLQTQTVIKLGIIQ
jgi:hypothetical protein